MSSNYRSRVSTPPVVITPEERQRQEMEAAIRRAAEAAERERQRQNQLHQQQLDELRRQQQQAQQALQQKMNQLNEQHQASILQHERTILQLRDQHDKALTKAMKDAEQKRREDARRFHDELDQAVGQLNGSINQLRIQTGKAIKTLRSETQQSIQLVEQNIQNLRNDTQKAISAQQKLIKQIQEGINDDKAKAAALRHQLTSAYNAMRGIVEVKNHQKYAPKQLAAIEGSMNNVDTLPDLSAIAVIHTGFNNLLTLNANIEEKRLAYEAKHQIAIRTAEEVLARIHENRKAVPWTDGDNNETKDEKGNIIKIEVDFWMEGAYTKLEEELVDLKKQVIEGLNDDKYTVDDLDKALDKILDIDKRQMQMVLESIQKAKASQVRAEMSDVIVERLENQRFSVMERGYENNDQRRGYIMKFDDGKSKIIVVINPEDNTVNNVVIGTVETDLNEADLIKQGQEINRIIADEGWTTNGGCCQHDGSADEALRKMYDIDIAEGIGKELKQQAGITDAAQSASTAAQH